MKMTYAEQLKHPNWQRRRLEMLEAAGFECSRCGDKETTLHVHHPRYIKGRMAWEYDNTELEVLCADCHENHHFCAKAIARLMQHADEYSILGLIAGYLSQHEDIDPGFIEECRQSGDALSFLGGVAADLIESAPLDHVREAVKVFATFRRMTPGRRGYFDDYLGDE